MARYIVKALIILLCCGVVSSQTLQRRTGPPTVQPESCRDHVARQRAKLVILAAQQRHTRLRADMNEIARDLDNPEKVVSVCSNRTLIQKLDIAISLAEYEHAVDMTGGGR